ncbi:MAG: hypothetical protein WBX25_07335 [Rhodomicrobium sp.]
MSVFQIVSSWKSAFAVPNERVGEWQVIGSAKEMAVMPPPLDNQGKAIGKRQQSESRS